MQLRESLLDYCYGWRFVLVNCRALETMFVDGASWWLFRHLGVHWMKMKKKTFPKVCDELRSNFSFTSNWTHPQFYISETKFYRHSTVWEGMLLRRASLSVSCFGNMLAKGFLSSKLCASSWAASPCLTEL